MSKFLLTSGFKWTILKSLTWINIVIAQKDVFLKWTLNIAKESWELHNDYPLAPNKTEMKREMLSEYRLKINDFYNVSFLIMKSMRFIIKTYSCTSD